jgi:hypothetical protein
VLARVFEETGLSTVALALIRNHAERVKPPRALFVPFPLGFALGKPNDPTFQHRVLEAAFDLLAAPSGPVVKDFGEVAEAPAEVFQASDVAPGAETTGEATPGVGDPADELTHLRGYYEQWLEDHEGRTMVGLTGVPQRRWRGLVRYLQGVADGLDRAYAERPADVPVLLFLRRAADDLKAFYFEAQMARRPDQVDNDLNRWFWSETAMGALLARVAERVAGMDEPDRELWARRIAR